jgi:hypothetical protein
MTPDFLRNEYLPSGPSVKEVSGSEITRVVQVDTAVIGSLTAETSSIAIVVTG